MALMVVSALEDIARLIERLDSFSICEGDLGSSLLLDKLITVD